MIQNSDVHSLDIGLPSDMMGLVILESFIPKP